MFAYCGNNPTSRIDDGGYFWDTILDVISLCISIHDVIENPDDATAWVGLAADVVSVALPFVGGAGVILDIVSKTDDAIDVADDVLDAKKLINSVHGNSLDYPGVNYGYILSDKTTGEIVKFGESIDPAHRYTKKFLSGNNPINTPLDMTVVISGTKRDVHMWQHDQIVDFYETVGELPRLNKSKW